MVGSREIDQGSLPGGIVSQIGRKVGVGGRVARPREIDQGTLTGGIVSQINVIECERRQPKGGKEG